MGWDFAVICLYKSWGSPTSAKLSLGIGSENELESGFERGRFVPPPRHQEPLAEARVGDAPAFDGHNEQLDREQETRMSELHEAKKQILQLERKIQELEGRIPRKYPDVTFLNYKNRKRILVSGSILKYTFQEFFHGNSVLSDTLYSTIISV